MKTFKFKDFFGQDRQETRGVFSKGAVQKVVKEIIKRETVVDENGDKFVPEVRVERSKQSQASRKINHI